MLEFERGSALSCSSRGFRQSEAVLRDGFSLACRKAVAARGGSFCRDCSGGLNKRKAAAGRGSLRPRRKRGLPYGPRSQKCCPLRCAPGSPGHSSLSQPGIGWLPAASGRAGHQGLRGYVRGSRQGGSRAGLLLVRAACRPNDGRRRLMNRETSSPAPCVPPLPPN